MKSKNDTEIQTEIFKYSQYSLQQLHRSLLNNPSLINSIDNRGESLLSYAIKNNNNKIYDLLLNSPFLFLNYQDKDGNSYLHLAIKNKNEKMIDILLRKGININLQNKYGNTVLHLAYEMGNLSVIKKLIENGVDINIKNNEKKIAEQIKKKITINKNSSVHNYNIISKKMKNNKSTSELKISNQDYPNLLKSSKKTKNKNIFEMKKQENGGVYDEDVRINLYKGNSPQYNIKKNDNDKEIKQNEIKKYMTSKTINEYSKKINKIKFNSDKFNKGGIYKLFTLKENNLIKDKDDIEEIMFYEEEDNIKSNNSKNKETKNIFKVNKKINNLQDSSSSFIISQSSDPRNNKKKIHHNNEIKSIDESDYYKYKYKLNKKNNNKDNNNKIIIKDINKGNTSSKKVKNHKRTTYRNSILGLNNMNNTEKWNTIQIKKSPKKINKKNTIGIGTTIKYKGSITKRNSPTRKLSPFDRSNTSRSKKNKSKNKKIIDNKNKNNNKNLYNESLISKNYKKNLIQRYENQLSDQENKDSKEMKEIKENKDSIFDKEKNDSKTTKSSQKNSIISINCKKNKDDNLLKIKASKLLRDFLSQINMDKYIGILTTNGFDDINLILEQSKNGGASIQDNELKEAGISKPGDRAKILIRIQELSNNFSFPVPKEIYHVVDDINDIENDDNIQKFKKWLENLKVEDYLINFIYSGYHSVELLLMQMISSNPLTIDMLKEEIGIDKIGYRSRIINKLKDESKSFLGQIKTKTLVINKGEENLNNCQCIII